jgi:hypothetical protein
MKVFVRGSTASAASGAPETRTWTVFAASGARASFLLQAVRARAAEAATVMSLIIFFIRQSCLIFFTEIPGTADFGVLTRGYISDHCGCEKVALQGILNIPKGGSKIAFFVHDGRVLFGDTPVELTMAIVVDAFVGHFCRYLALG